MTDCGHVNKQFYGEDGKLTDISCVLPEGHSGDHSAPHPRKIADHEYGERGRIIKTTYHTEDAVASWSDAAGKKAEEYREQEVVQMNALQRDIVMDILQKNPNLKIEEAIARAKETEGWNVKVL